MRSTNGIEQNYTHLDNKLTISLSKDNDAIPVIVIEFDNEPKFCDISIQHGNLLTLTPYYGKKYCIDGDTDIQKELVFQYNLFDPLWGKRGLSLSFNATVCAWTEEKEFLEWDAEFTEDGEYACELVTAKMGGEALVEVLVDGESVCKKITLENADSAFKLSRTGVENFRYVYNLGSVKVKKGKKLITIRRKGNGVNVPVAELKFRKI